MNKITLLSLSLIFFSFNCTIAQSTFSSNEMLISFSNSASLHQIHNLKNKLDATQSSSAMDAAFLTWQITFPVTFLEPNGDEVHLENILEVLEYSEGQAEVDGVGLNYHLTTELGANSIESTPIGQGAYYPIPNCHSYPGDVMGSGGVSEGLKIGIIDTGLDDSHPMINQFVAGGHNFITNTSSIYDDLGHGTEIAGIIAGELETSGIDNAELYILKAMDSNGTGNLSTIIQAVDYAIDHQIDILNLSLGYTPSYIDTYSTMLENVLTEASNSGMLIITSAGNNTLDLNQNVYYPAGFTSIPNLITVASTNCNGMISSFSNYGSDVVELGVPGEDVFCPTSNGGWILKNGTSFATAILSGIAAQVGSNLLNGFDAEKVKCNILNTVVPVPSLDYLVTTGGVVNAEEACLNTSDCGIFIPKRQGQEQTYSAFDAVLNCYPNPMKESINIAFKATTANTGSLQLFNTIGELVYAAPLHYVKGENSIQLNEISHLSAGVYTLSLNLKGETISQRIIKSN